MLLSLSLMSILSFAAESETLFTSNQGIIESCQVLNHLDQANYSEGDIKKESELCQIDIANSQDIGVCPKTWSTSPGVIIYDLKETSFEKQRSQFESQFCGKGKTRQYKAIAKYKVSIAEANTSSTESRASLAYYALSRFFDTQVKVPVAVRRTLNIEIQKKLARLGSANSKSANQNGWDWVLKIINNPSSSKYSHRLISENGETVTGVLFKESGQSYGPEFNGIDPAWGSQSTIDFGNTIAFWALRQKSSLKQALASAHSEYKAYLIDQKNKTAKSLFKKGNPVAHENAEENLETQKFITNEQLISWMQDATEIVILDTLLGQEDRNLNIDFKWVVFDQNPNASLKTRTLKDNRPLKYKAQIQQDNLVNENQILIQRTHLNDNDAALRVTFTNFLKKTNLIQHVHHMNPNTFEKLRDLVLDLQNQGAIYSFLKDDIGLSLPELTQITANAEFIWINLESKKQRGDLYLDLPKIEELFNLEPRQ